MRCCEHNLWMNQRTSALVHIQLLWIVIHLFLPQDGDHPRKFPKLSFVVIVTGYAEAYAICVTMAAPSPQLWCWCDWFGHPIGLLAAHIEVVLTRPILDPAKELLGMQWLQSFEVFTTFI